MLADSKLQSIIWTSDVRKAEHFYTEILRLPFVGESHGALVYRINGADLRVSPVPRTGPTEHTVLGFAVADVRTVVRKLASLGIAIERIPDFRHDDDGILSVPGGGQVAWFRDPDGNLLSVVQYSDG
jgi:catechol 2,3-dioxygenase-like lactoylglutathione lyase family enzyme